ncbi:MAG: hypothetical protein A3D92_12375 [Bacteroidetes bacterium RIFCSPHIGHO2_02_FULL_44_7]|nr:MAG: hypothetical protein A3D92_12375 [Bacteroidetes bacterium RIFCSPHIGHO2_02_FULL_44_7]
MLNTTTKTRKLNAIDFYRDLCVLVLLLVVGLYRKYASPSASSSISTIGGKMRRKEKKNSSRYVTSEQEPIPVSMMLEILFFEYWHGVQINTNLFQVE